MWYGCVADLSLGGVRLVLDRRVEVGAVLRIRVRRGLEGPSALLLARVIHVTQGVEGQWVLGCQFPVELDQTMFEVLLHGRQGQNRFAAGVGEVRLG